MVNRLIINKDNLKYNLEQIKHKVGNGVQIAPIVKANAYGVGLKEVTSIINTNYYALGNIKEALKLKSLVPSANILIIYQPFLEDIETIINYDFIPFVSDLNFIKELNEKALAKDKKIRVHIELDTGMSRLGIKEGNLEEFAETIKTLSNIIVEGICTHYSCANNIKTQDLIFTQNQTDLFKIMVDKIQKIIGEVKYLHTSSGAGVFNPHSEIFNLVRPGYMLYGYYIDEELKNYVKLKPVLKLATKIIQINEYKENTYVGYNRNFITKRPTKIATIAMGYADGLFRSLSNQASLVVNKQKAPIIGNVCMDTAMLDITDIKGDIKVGDDVYIFDNEIVTLEELVNIIGTTGYEFLARINPNVEKLID